MPSPGEMFGYMRAVARGSPVDPQWSVGGILVSRLRDGLAPEDSPLTVRDVMSRADYRDLRTPKVAEGDIAPDFELPRVDGEGSRQPGLTPGRAARRARLRLVHLTAFPGAGRGARGAGCRIRRQRALPRRLHSRGASGGGVDPPGNRRSGLAVNEPTSEDKRREVASTCAVNLHLKMPMVVDGLDNVVASAYGGWPDRLYLISRGGRIAFQSGEGPFGFKPEDLARAQARARDLVGRGEIPEAAELRHPRPAGDPAG